MSFESLGLTEALLRTVKAEGYSTPTPIQQQAIPHVMAGRDLLGCAQTGTGKTAAFALPLLHRLTASGSPPKGRGRKTRALVLSPTRELASQIADSFNTYGRATAIRHTVVYGGVSQHPQTRALFHGVDVLVATPGRLLDLMNQGHVDLSHIETFVLDEADRMLDMGFMPDIKRIIAKLPEKRQTVMFSATMPAAIEQFAQAILRDPVDVRLKPEKVTTDLIQQSVYHVDKTNKPRLLAELVRGENVSQVIVFTRTKHGADRVVRQLTQSGVRCDAIHGNKSQNARQRTLQAFKNNRVQVLVATDIAARGIDVDGLSHVVNYDLPHEPETYIHRIGRTGRAGATGMAWSFCEPEDRKLLFAIERLIRKSLDAVVGHPLTLVPPPQRDNSRPSGDRPQRSGGNGGRSRFSRGAPRSGSGNGNSGGQSSEGGGPKKPRRRFSASR